MFMTISFVLQFKFSLELQVINPIKREIITQALLPTAPAKRLWQQS